MTIRFFRNLKSNRINLATGQNAPIIATIVWPDNMVRFYEQQKMILKPLVKLMESQVRCLCSGKMKSYFQAHLSSLERKNAGHFNPSLRNDLRNGSINW